MPSNRTPSLALHEHICDLAPVMHWLEQHPELDVNRVSIHTWVGLGLEVSMSIQGHDVPARFAVAEAAINDGAPDGCVRRVVDDRSTAIVRDFGAARVKVWALTDDLPYELPEEEWPEVIDFAGPVPTWVYERSSVPA